MKGFVRKGAVSCLTVLMAASVFTGCSKENNQEEVVTDEQVLESTINVDASEESLYRSLRYWSSNNESFVENVIPDVEENPDLREGLNMDFFVLDMNNDSTTEIISICHTEEGSDLYFSYVDIFVEDNEFESAYIFGNADKDLGGYYTSSCTRLIKENIADLYVKYAFYDGEHINYLLKYTSTKEIDDTTSFVEEGYLRFYMDYYNNPWGGYASVDGIYSSIDPEPVLCEVKHISYYKYIEDGELKLRNAKYYIGEGEMVTEEEYFGTKSLTNYIYDITNNDKCVIFDVSYNPVKGVDYSTTVDKQWIYNELLGCYSSYGLTAIKDVSNIEKNDVIELE